MQVFYKFIAPAISELKEMIKKGELTKENLIEKTSRLTFDYDTLTASALELESEAYIKGKENA